MPFNDPLKAIVRVTHGNSLGDAMSQIRNWLDAEKVQSSTFTTSLDARGYTLAIGFRSSIDADRFRRQYGG